MVVLKVNGDLTINSGAYLTTIGNANGGPKGFLIYVTGTITNNGEISMTSRGARAVGQDVYLWQNIDKSYEYVPAYGAAGGARKYVNGYNVGASGVNRQTGGGGSGQVGGGISQAYSGAGAAGTSYSGGSGGGGFYRNVSSGGMNPGDGSANGGQGGGGGRATMYGTNGGSGGAGNPGGTSYCGVIGQNGTGGLLTIYGYSFKNSGIISSNGANGGTSNMWGGGSGGGSINIFYNNIIQEGTMTANGGNYAGRGCISKGKIFQGMYVEGN